MKKIEHIEIWHSYEGWDKQLIDANKYPNICSELFSTFWKNAIMPIQYLTFITKYGSNIYIIQENYLDGINYCWQLLGYKCTGLYGDNHEYPDYNSALKEAINHSFSLIEETIVECLQDDMFVFDTNLLMRTTEEQEQDRINGDKFLAKFKKLGIHQENSKK